MPGEDQRGPGVRRELGALRGGVAGAEEKAAGVVALHQDHTGVGRTVGVRGGDDDGVGLGQLGGYDVGEPAVELLHPGGGEFLLGEVTGGVVPAHAGEVWHAAMLTPRRGDSSPEAIPSDDRSPAYGGGFPVHGDRIRAVTAPGAVRRGAGMAGGCAW